MNNVQIKNIREYMQMLPSASINNSREIVQKKIISFYKRPSEGKARELEQYLPEQTSIDYDNGDMCDEPRGWEQDI